GYTHGCEFDAMPTGIAYGRSINTAGKDVFAIRKPTLGEANGLPLLGPVLITEVHYHPGEDDAEEAMEFIEIWNRTDHPMPLFDPERPENVWALKGTKFTFPPGQTLAPNEGAVITRMAPEEFRKKRALPESMKIYGPFEGGLNNSGERLTLLRPLAPELDGEDSVIPMVPVDSLRYNDKIPWPDEADGTGRTLERLDVTGITDEPQSWRASVENGGTPGQTRFTLPTTNDDNS
ncbi:MAG: lamin tail domain-containing protein, partial [Verrucomicrobiales bacterium]